MNHLQMLYDRSQCQRRHERQRSDNHDDTGQQDRKQPTMRRKSARTGRRYFFLRQTAGNGQHGKDDAKSADEHRRRQHQVIKGGIGIEPGKCAAIVAGAGSESVQDFAEPVRARVGK